MEQTHLMAAAAVVAVVVQTPEAFPVMVVMAVMV
jgi:hypothetical protein